MSTNQTKPADVSAGIEALLLGASGFLGPALIKAFPPGKAIATHFRHPGDGTLQFDVRETPVGNLLHQSVAVPSAAVILLGNTTIDDCARDPVGSAEVNVRGIIRVIDELRSLGITPVFVSSDGVFDGSRSYWEETDAPCPILEYGRQKAAVEGYLSSLAPPWLIVRPPKLLATDANPRCMLHGWVRALGNEGKILCATDQYLTPASAEDVAAAIVALIRTGAQGYYHLGGPQRLSRRDLLELTVLEYRKFSATRADIVECSLRDIPVLEPRPLDASLCSDRVHRALDLRFMDPAEIVRASVSAHFTVPTTLTR